MKVQDFGQTVEINSLNELEDALQHRYADGYNEFSLLHSDSDEPDEMMIMAKSDMASLYYLPGDRKVQPHMSIGSIPGLNPANTTTFRSGNINTKQDVVNYSIIPFIDAVRAAKEFFISRKLPTSIKWEEL